MRYGSVCSGIEAASVAWHPLGWEPAFFSEIEPFPSAVLSHRFPSVPNRGDMTCFKEWPHDPIDLLVGGTPCQSFSVAGLRRGLDDPRGSLMLTYLALARRLLPRWIVWENVPGVLSSAEGRDFGALLTGLGQLGYGFAWRVLDAQFVRVDGLERAVPQRRRRVFVVGHLGDWRRAAAVLFDAASVQRHPPPRRGSGQVAPTVPARSTGGGGLGTDFDCDAGLIAAEAAPALTRGYGSSAGQDLDQGAGLIAHALRGEGFDASEDDTGRGAPVIPILEVGKGTGSRGAGQNGSGLGKPGDPMFTLQAGAQHAVAQGWAVRRLTPTECERLQGFPDGWTDIPWRGKPHAPDGPRYKALGNSMAVNVMRWIGRRIETVEARWPC